jgi:hypothetical protein
MTDSTAIAPAVFGLAEVPLQPVVNVPAYLAARSPVADCNQEEPLLITLPARVRDETRALCRACLLVLARVGQGSKVQPACIAVIAIFGRWSWKLNTFRPKYDAWAKAGDWVVLVNRAKAGAAWIDRNFGLPDAFLDFAAGRVGEFKRGDATAEALRSIRRQWQTGFNHRGEVEVIPGYESGWHERRTGMVPAGWSLGNLREQLKRRAKITRAQKALLHEGISAARAFIPQIRSTRDGLRFMEEVQFDDVKCDFRVFDTGTGKPVDLWLLVAHDRATAMLLGFGMRPATVREDGSQEHLTLRDMKQLSGWLLERYGLPPYRMTWKVENGTATYTDGTAAAIEELLPQRIHVSFSQMISGASPSGYLERALGNSKGKASLESHNRIMHLIGAGLPGQVGPHYGVRPKDIAAREAECVRIWSAASEMPDGLRERLVNEFGYPLLTLQQARQELVRIFSIRNARTDHSLEGFEKILVSGPQGPMQRMESPAERASRLCAGLAFDRVSPEVICAFYEHTQRVVTVTDAGEIEFTHESRKLTFASLDGTHPAPGSRLLAYFHPDDPRFLHVTTGKGAMVGTWLRRALVKNGDPAALADAMHYAGRALKTAKDRAAQLNHGEVRRLTEMRERNAQLLQANTFIDVTPVARMDLREVSSPVAGALAGIVDDRKDAKREAARREKNLRAFDGDASELVEASEPTPSPGGEGRDEGGPSDVAASRESAETDEDFSPEGLL